MNGRFPLGPSSRDTGTVTEHIRSGQGISLTRQLHGFGWLGDDSRERHGGLLSWFGFAT